MTRARAAEEAAADGARPARTVFLGSGRFAVPILERLASLPQVALLAIVTAPDRPAERGQRPRSSPVARVAGARGWRLLRPERLRAPESVGAIEALAPELLVLADYGQLVPPGLLALPRHGALNVHPSLLPRHRGASPVAATILAGDAETGVTLFVMDEGLDTGPLVAQERLALAGTEPAPELEARLAALGAALLAGVLRDWLAGRIVPRPQPAEGATLTRPLRREDGRVDWSRPAVELERRVRAHAPWPGSFSDSPIGRLIVRRAAPLPAIGDPDLPPGTLVADGRGLAVACGEGLLRLLAVQPAGRRPMSGEALRNGFPRLVGARLG